MLFYISIGQVWLRQYSWGFFPEVIETKKGEILKISETSFTFNHLKGIAKCDFFLVH
jgi:hypothetical protein